jgi:predicted ATPase
MSHPPIALADRVAAGAPKGWVFFDRGLIDAAVALYHLTGEPALGASAISIGITGVYSSRRHGRRSMPLTPDDSTTWKRRWPSTIGF